MEKYDNLGMVGEGSYGMVMKCKHKETGQIVAIKKFLESEDDKMVKKIAMREVRMLRKLRHENLVNLIEVFRRRKRLYLVFEFVDHTILDDLEKYPNGLNEMTVRKILWQVLRGVEFCHSHNIIHRDIKPENILNSKSGVIKLCDFGFARTLAAPGEVYTDYVATRWYRAPELLVGDTKYGRPVDIWAVGCLITEMLTGDPLFPGDSDIDQLYHIIKCFGNLCPRHREIFQRNPLFAGMRLPDVKDVEPLEKKFPKFSSEVLDLMKQSLRLDPNDRPSSSMLLRHEFFKKDNFEEKVIPELRARISKDAASSLVVRKDPNKETDKEKKKKKMKELISNTSLENQVPDNNNKTNKKSPDQKSLQSNSPKKVDPSNSPKKADLTNSPKKTEPSNSPKKHDPASPKKDNLPKSILKTSNPSTPGNEVKNQQRDADKTSETKIMGESSNFVKYLPSVDSNKQVSMIDINPTKQSKTTFKEQNTTSHNEKTSSNMPQISKKKSSDDLQSKSLPVSRDGPTSAALINEKPKSDKPRKSSTKREIAPVNSQEQRKQTISENNKKTKSKNLPVSKVSSDTVILKDKPSGVISRSDVDKVFSTDHIRNMQVDSGVRITESKPVRKETLRKSPKASESPIRPNIPPIVQQNTSKDSSPDLNVYGSSPTSSTPHQIPQKPTPVSNPVSIHHHKNVEKAKKHTVTKLNEISPQSSFDRSMYPDKTSHLEKIMISMSGTTTITHPALKKSHVGPTSQPHLTPVSTTGYIIGTNSMQYLRHNREEKHPTLPIWSSVALEDKAHSIHSSLDSNFSRSDAKMHRTDEFLKPREKSSKQSKKDKNRAHNQDERTLRGFKTDSQVTRLPDLARKSNFQDLSPIKYGISEGTKLKKSTSKTLGGMPSLDVNSMPHTKQERSTDSPSTGNVTSNNNSNIIEGNFPSVYMKN